MIFWSLAASCRHRWRLPNQDSGAAEKHVQKITQLMRHLKSVSFAYDRMPARAVLLVQGVFDKLASVLPKWSKIQRALEQGNRHTVSSHLVTTSLPQLCCEVRNTKERNTRMIGRQDPHPIIVCVFFASRHHKLHSLCLLLVRHVTLLERRSVRGIRR